MKIIIIPDSYKGCLSSTQVGEAMVEGIKASAVDCQIERFTAADGGEGTTEAFVEAEHGRYITIGTMDAFMRSIKVNVGVINDDTAVLEVAAIIGLTMLDIGARDPLRETSYGVGLAIRTLYEKGFRKIIIGLGGSSTNDGGMGMLQALGMVFKDETGRGLNPMAVSLNTIETVENNLYELKNLQLTVATDVRNPLLGENGATYVYGPQKGATASDLRQLEAGMVNFARVMAAGGWPLTAIVGGGAAGGLGAALTGVLHAHNVSGIEQLLQSLNFAARLSADTIVISGEGRSDSQSAEGKLIAGIAGYTKPRGIPLYIISGSLGSGYERLYALGVTEALALMDWAKDAHDSFANAYQLITEITRDLMIRLNDKSGGYNRIT